MVKTISDTSDVTSQLLERNQGDVGRYFKNLVGKGLAKWEEWVVILLVRSRAYRDNDLKGLLALANDLRNVHQAQIDFVEKYSAPAGVDNLFHQNAAKMDREVTGFLIKTIIPYLTHAENQGNFKKR